MAIRLIFLVAFAVVAVSGNTYWRRGGNDNLKAELECGQQSADIVFVLDESGSIWGPHFKLQLQFVNGISDYMDIAPNATRIGVMTFSDEYRHHFDLGDITNPGTMHSKLNGIQQMRGGTKTYKALSYMREQMFAPGKIRSWVPQIAIVITDGESEDTMQTAHEANLVKDNGIQVFAIGVGHSINPKELEAIASDATKVYSVDNFNALQDIKLELAIKTCEVTTIPPLSTTTVTTTTATTTTPPPQYIDGCTGRFTPDIVFTIPDELGITDTRHSIDFVKSVVGSLNIGPAKTLAGIAPRKCVTARPIRLKDYDSADGIHGALDDRYMEGAAIHRQLEYLSTKAFAPNAGGRDNAARFAVMILDNNSEDPQATLAAAREAQGLMDIFVIGVGDYVDREEAIQLASADPFFISVDNFASLANVKDELLTKICQSITGAGFNIEAQ